MADDRDHPNGAGGFTRRGLIKGLATTAVATATAGAAALAEERAKTDATSGGGLPVSLTLNGAVEEGRLRAAHDARRGAARRVGTHGHEESGATAARAARARSCSTASP